MIVLIHIHKVSCRYGAFYIHSIGYLTFKMSNRKIKTTKKPKKRAARATSNVFAMFSQAQIQEFKEAFNMIDQNHDSFIDGDDLRDMNASLGKVVSRRASYYCSLLRQCL